MPFDVTLPIYLVSVFALVAALTCARRLVQVPRIQVPRIQVPRIQVPRIQVRAQNEKHGALRVIELALVLSPGRKPARGTEFVVYITLKTCNP
jgi:hypothetical protein